MAGFVSPETAANLGIFVYRRMLNRKSKLGSLVLFTVLCLGSLPVFGSESDIHIPDLKTVSFFGGSLTGMK